MSFQPEKITREHVLEAAKIMDTGEWDITESTGYDALVNGKSYPPKELMRFAHERATGDFMWNPGGGEPTNKYIRALGFEIIDKKNPDPFVQIIKDYKSLISKKGNSDEIYKWQLILINKNKFNLNPETFFEDFKSIKFQNLVYHNGIAAINHMAKEFPADVCECFKNLFDESKNLNTRIDDFTNETLKIYRKLEPKLYHHQDERTIATYLTFKYPEKYTFYKDSFYRKLCKRLNLPSEKKGKKFQHYLSIVKGFIFNDINNDDELIALKESFLTDDCYKDENNNILAQDIFYQALENASQFNKNYWRIGTVIDEGSLWEEMKAKNFVGIGWGKLGNLNDLSIVDRKSIQNILKPNGYYIDDNRTASQKAGEIFSFYDEIKNGDVVLAQDGAKVLGIGIVKDEYNFIDESIAPHQHSIDWVLKEPNLKNNEGLRTTVYKLQDVDLIKNIEKVLESIESKPKTDMSNNNMQSLNTILYGPPGTGKTYNSINLSLEILGEDISKKSRKDIKAIYDEYVKKGQIVFTTFHQSMSYEDFIEGIKPVTSDDNEGNISYDIESGVFKSLCDKARIKGNSNFESAYEALLQDISKLEGEPLELKTPTGKSFYVAINSKNNLSLLTGKERKQQGVFTKEKLIRQLNGEKLFIGWEGYYTGIIDYLKEKYKLSSTINVTNKKYVIIIDEINRGNVSQIFGELITLIEDDKREGKPEALEVILPYSKEKFSVPDNLYIIGTMNTADRSVEALDTALRRRFNFIEMAPNLRVVEQKAVGEISGAQLSKILSTINKRLEKLLGKDHLIGHSFFVNVQSLNDLKYSFQNKIIPLLQEYFYGDYGKIGLVLGKGFVSIKESESNLFADFEYDSDLLNEKIIYEIVDFTSKRINHSIKIKDKMVDVDFEMAIKLLIDSNLA
ncbi:MAG: AAA family ATPase [Bacteroidia bacterium]